MKRLLAPFAAIAAVLIVSGVAIYFWNTTASGIALADVLAEVQQVTAYMYQMTATVTTRESDGRPVNGNTESTILISQDGRMKMSMAMTDSNDGEFSRQEMYMLPEEKAMIMVMPDQKKYVRIDLDETMIEKARHENYNPSTMLEQVLDSKYESLGRSRIDGVKVEGFRTTDPDYLGGLMGRADSRIWVDVKTRLPVRMEVDVETEMASTRIEMHGVIHNFQWDYPVDATTFTPIIPDDYAPMAGSGMKMPAMDEAGAIAGLRLHADLTGRYPEKLDFMTIISLMEKLDDEKDMVAGPPIDANETPSIKDEIEKMKELPIEEQRKKIDELRGKTQELITKSQERLKNMDQEIRDAVEKVMPIQGTVMFYMLLAEEGKEPAYYGDVVTPQDVDQVLLRWKISDTEYRVLFGSLHAETVNAATLAELEKSLAK